MRIQHKISKKFSEVTADIWQMMHDKGLSRKWIVISSEKTQSEKVTPEDISDVEFKGYLSAALKFRKAGNLKQAKKEYESAYEIKPVPYIKGHITSIQKKIDEDTK